MCGIMIGVLMYSQSDRRISRTEGKSSGNKTPVRPINSHAATTTRSVSVCIPNGV